MHFSALPGFLLGDRESTEKHLSTLGLEAGASEKHVKQSYYNLIRTAHPDKGGDCESFRAIQEAYRALSDLGAEREAPREDGGLQWMFEARKTRALQVELEVSEEELRGGCRKQVGVCRKVLEGSPDIFSKTTCLGCMGSGYLSRVVQDQRSTHLFQEECPACDARGFFLPMQVVVENVEVEIPAGAVDGYQIVVEGAADDERPFRLPGDLLVACRARRTGGEGTDDLRGDSERGAGEKLPVS